MSPVCEACFCQFYPFFSFQELSLDKTETFSRLLCSQTYSINPFLARVCASVCMVLPDWIKGVSSFPPSDFSSFKYADSHE